MTGHLSPEERRRRSPGLFASAGTSRNKFMTFYHNGIAPGPGIC